MSRKDLVPELVPNEGGLRAALGARAATSLALASAAMTPLGLPERRGPAPAPAAPDPAADKAHAARIAQSRAAKKARAITRRNR